jgi:hypothetical protein
MDRLGEGKLILRTDQEPSIEDVAREAASRRQNFTELQVSPKRSKGALGAAEAMLFSVES